VRLLILNGLLELHLVLHFLLLICQNRVLAQMRHSTHHLSILLRWRPRQRSYLSGFGMHDWDLSADTLFLTDGGVGVGIIL